jgi:ATP-dependent protease ClpP protease subunit
MQPNSTTLYCYGEITPQFALAVQQAIDAGVLKTIWIHSDGGCLNSALAIFDALKRHGGITVIGTGVVASAGLVVLLGGARRYATPQTRFMSHGPSLEAVNGQRVEHADFEELKEMERTLAQLIQAETRVGAVRAMKMVAQTCFFSVREALKDGIIDSDKPFEEVHIDS